MHSVAPARVRTRNAQFRWGVPLIVLLSLGCGGAQVGVVETTGRTHHVDPTGMRVVSITRPTPDVVRVSMWIDAGSRDAEPPQLATLGAWAAASVAGSDVQARALPDAIEIWIECAAGDIGSAVQRLARALAARDVDDGVLTTLRQQLAEHRARQALAGPPHAEHAALAAALGDAQAAAFFPFGAADDDAQISPGDVAEFLADHFGPNRAALVAVGDVRASLLSTAIGAHVAGLPQARAARATRTLEIPSAATAPRVDHARESAAAVAVVSADRDAVATKLTDLHRRWTTLAPDVRWTPVRGGAIGVAVARTTEPLAAIRAAFDPALPSDLVKPAAPHEDLAALSERAGLELCAPAVIGASSALGVGVAATLAEAARSGPEAEPRAQARLDATQRDLQRAIDNAARVPSYRGEVGTQAAHVVLSNGARIVVQRRDSEQVGIAISFLGGASEEHHTSHGRTALLTLLSAQACEGIGPGALSARLRSWGATFSPMLEASAFGLRMSTTRAHWRESLELLTRCALRPLLNRRVLRDAQARMLESLSADRPHGRAAQVANVLAPAHPGTIAHWGAYDSALLDLDVIVRAHAHAAVGARLALAIVGEVPVEEVVNVAAAHLVGQPAGALPQALTADSTAPEVSVASSDDPAPLALVAFRIAQADANPIGARVFAALLAETLTQTPMLTLTWLEAGHFPTGAWAGMGLSLSLEGLEQLNAVVDKALHELASPAGRARARALLERAIRQHASARSEPVHEATWLVNNALHGVQSEATRDRAEHTFDTFVRARPHYLVSRGNTARVSNNAAASRP